MHMSPWAFLEDMEMTAARWEEGGGVGGPGLRSRRLGAGVVVGGAAARAALLSGPAHSPA